MSNKRNKEEVEGREKEGSMSHANTWVLILTTLRIESISYCNPFSQDKEQSSALYTKHTRGNQPDGWCWLLPREGLSSPENVDNPNYHVGYLILSAWLSLIGFFFFLINLKTF